MAASLFLLCAGCSMMEMIGATGSRNQGLRPVPVIKGPPVPPGGPLFCIELVERVSRQGWIKTSAGQFPTNYSPCPP